MRVRFMLLCRVPCLVLMTSCSCRASCERWAQPSVVLVQHRLQSVDLCMPFSPSPRCLLPASRRLLARLVVLREEVHQLLAEASYLQVHAQLQLIGVCLLAATACSGIWY